MLGPLWWHVKTCGERGERFGFHDVDPWRVSGSGQSDVGPTTGLLTIDCGAPVARPQSDQSEPGQQQHSTNAEGEVQVGGIANGTNEQQTNAIRNALR